MPNIICSRITTTLQCKEKQSYYLINIAICSFNFIEIKFKITKKKERKKKHTECNRNYLQKKQKTV